MINACLILTEECSEITSKSSIRSESAGFVHLFHMNNNDKEYERRRGSVHETVECHSEPHDRAAWCFANQHISRIDRRRTRTTLSVGRWETRGLWETRGGWAKVGVHAESILASCAGAFTLRLSPCAAGLSHLSCTCKTQRPAHSYFVSQKRSWTPKHNVETRNAPREILPLHLHYMPHTSTLTLGCDLHPNPDQVL